MRPAKCDFETRVRFLSKAAQQRRLKSAHSSVIDRSDLLGQDGALEMDSLSKRLERQADVGGIDNRKVSLSVSE